MTPRAGATPTPMMFKLRPRAISPTSTAILPVPISTAPTILLLLEITFFLPGVSWLNGEIAQRSRALHGLLRHVAEENGHLVVEGEVDRLERRLGHHARRVLDHKVELGDLLEEI